MATFWRLFEQSVIVQAVVTAALIITVCVMYIMQTPIPSELLNLVLVVLGFWFGSKVGYVQGNRRSYERTLTSGTGDD